MSEKRQRDRPNRKWNKREVDALVQYLLEHKSDLESPTAQIFYKRFLEFHPIEGVSWSLLRWKVRNMKQSLLKALAWHDAVEKDSLYNADTHYIRSKLLRMCPYYEQLSQIFAAKLGSASDTLKSHTNNNNNNDAVQVKTEMNYSSMEDECYQSENTYELTEHAAAPTTATEPHDEQPLKFLQTLQTLQSRAHSLEVDDDGEDEEEDEVLTTPRTCTPHSEPLTHLQTEQLALQRAKLEFEREKLLAEVENQKRRLALDERKLEAELEWQKNSFTLKRLEIEKNDRLRILELESRERLAMYELQMKYKLNKK